MDDAVDPLARVAELPGVFEAVEAARGAVDALRRDLRGPDLRRRGPEVTAAALRRSALASASLAADSGEAVEEGALRAYAELPGLARTWGRAPAQVLARLHVLAAAGLADVSSVGRPRDGAGVSQRLGGLVDLVTTGSSVPAVVTAAVVHGELLALAPFGTADGVVARAASRLVLVERGLDPTAVVVVEEGHVELGTDDYQAALAAYASGTPGGVARWVAHCAQAVALGARVARGLAAELVGPGGD